MSSVFNLENFEDFSEKINIDELYEKKRQSDLNKLNLFNKILNRIHIRIKNVSKQRKAEQFCWYVVPEVILGVPKYDQGACIAYLIDKLKDNGFNVRYVHPNTLFISWLHWVPSYVRTEIKKKTGISLNEYGIKIDENSDKPDEPQNTDDDPNNFMVRLKDQQNQSQIKSQNKKQYTPINSYKPSGNLVYDDDLLNKIEDKFN